MYASSPERQTPLQMFSRLCSGCQIEFFKILRCKICSVTVTKERLALLLRLAPSRGCAWPALERRALDWGAWQGPLVITPVRLLVS